MLEATPCWRRPPRACLGALDAEGWFHTGDLGRWEEVTADNDGLPGRGAAAGGEAPVAVAADGTEVGGGRGAPRWRLRVVERLGFVVKLSNGEFLAPQRAEAEFEARCAWLGLGLGFGSGTGSGLGLGSGLGSGLAPNRPLNLLLRLRLTRCPSVDRCVLLASPGDAAATAVVLLRGSAVAAGAGAAANRNPKPNL